MSTCQHWWVAFYSTDSIINKISCVRNSWQAQRKKKKIELRFVRCTKRIRLASHWIAKVWTDRVRRRLSRFRCNWFNSYLTRVGRKRARAKMNMRTNMSVILISFSRSGQSIDRMIYGFATKWTVVVGRREWKSEIQTANINKCLIVSNEPEKRKAYVEEKNNQRWMPYSATIMIDENKMNAKIQSANKQKEKKKQDEVNWILSLEQP